MANQERLELCYLRNGADLNVSLIEPTIRTQAFGMWAQSSSQGHASGLAAYQL